MSDAVTPGDDVWSARRRSFAAAARLGWLLESNWADPKLFVLYIVVRPLTSSLVLVCMYYAARQVTAVPPDFLPYMYVGNACFALVGAVMFGMSQAVISDREHYRMLKYLYVAPTRLRSYLAGRALSGGAQALLGGVINLIVGYFAFPQVREAFARHGVEWGWLALYLVLGVVLLTALGMMLSALMLNMSRQASFLSEGVAGVMYLACGVIFPLTVLPSWMGAIGRGLPPTYWIEGVRRSLLGPAGPAKSALDAWTHPQLAGALALTSAAAAFGGYYLFRWSERRAWRNGRLEETTGA